MLGICSYPMNVSNLTNWHHQTGHRLTLAGRSAGWAPEWSVYQGQVVPRGICQPAWPKAVRESRRLLLYSAHPSSLAWTTRNVTPSQSGLTHHTWKQFKKILEGTVLDPAGYIKPRESSPVPPRPPQRVSQDCLQKRPAIYHPSGEAGVCLALGPPVNDCHMHLIATPTRAPYLPAQGYKPDSLITTGPSGSPGPVTTSTGNEATWKSAQLWVGAGVAHDFAWTFLALARLDAPWTLNSPSAE